MVPRPTQVLNPNGSSIGAAVFAGLTIVTDRPTDRPTDHATLSVRIGIYTYVVLRCGLKIMHQGSRVQPAIARFSWKWLVNIFTSMHDL